MSCVKLETVPVQGGGSVCEQIRLIECRPPAWKPKKGPKKSGILPPSPRSWAIYRPSSDTSLGRFVMHFSSPTNERSPIQSRDHCWALYLNLDHDIFVRSKNATQPNLGPHQPFTLVPAPQPQDSCPWSPWVTCSKWLQLFIFSKTFMYGHNDSEKKENKYESMTLKRLTILTHIYMFLIRIGTVWGMKYKWWLFNNIEGQQEFSRKIKIAIPALPPLYWVVHHLPGTIEQRYIISHTWNTYKGRKKHAHMQTHGRKKKASNMQTHYRGKCRHWPTCNTLRSTYQCIH